MVDAAHFEAKKHAYRQTQDGVVISFVVHPNDLNAALAVAPLGTRYIVAVAEIGDDGEAVSPGPEGKAGNGSPAVSAAPPPPPKAADGPGEATKGGWYGLKPSARAALLCKSDDFATWAANTFGVQIDDMIDADQWLKNMVDTPAKKMLDPTHEHHRPDALKKFNAIERAYRTARGMETEAR